jgi:Tol biopolymer transport system component
MWRGGEIMKRIAWSLVVAALALSSLASAQEFGPWSAPVNLGAPVNTLHTETAPAVSKDGLSLYFTCADCAQGPGIYVAQRNSTEETWGAPQYLWAINQYGSFSDPTLSIDGHQMYITGPGTSGLPGDTDIYISRRHNKRDDFGWGRPVNLTSINTEYEDGWAAPFEDEMTGITYLYFVSNRPGGLGDSDIYVSTLQVDVTFGAPVLVAELSSSGRDRHPSIRRDGLEIFFMSNRAGSLPNVAGNLSFDI